MLCKDEHGKNSNAVYFLQQQEPHERRQDNTTGVLLLNAITTVSKILLSLGRLIQETNVTSQSISHCAKTSTVLKTDSMTY